MGLLRRRPSSDETQTDDVPAGSHLVRPADPMTSHTLYYGMWDCHRAASDNRSELVTFDPQSSRRASWFFPFVRTRLWLNALHVFIKGFLSNQMKMRRFLVSAAQLQRVSAPRLSVQTKDSSHDVIFALRDAWRRAAAGKHPQKIMDAPIKCAPALNSLWKCETAVYY